MNFSKIALLCGLSAAMSFAGITINVNTGNSHKKHREEPPPPPQNLNLRSCDENVCCDLHVDGQSSKYDLRCNGPIERASVNVSNSNGSFNEQLNEGRGKLRGSLDHTSRGDLRIKAKRKPHYKTRLCDDGVCCDLDQDPYSFNYTFTCNGPYERADLLVKGNGRKDHYSMSDRGRLNGELTSHDKVELRIKRPAPPPPEKKKKEGKVDIRIRL